MRVKGRHRIFWTLPLGFLVASWLSGPSLGVRGFYAWGQPAKKVLVLGVDGLDPKILQNLVEKGELPHFKRLIAEGDFKPLGTSMPPQSPVAWSNFITGMDPGGHGIYDFVHRNPDSTPPVPHLSISQTLPASKNIPIGKWVLPLSSGQVELQRKGKAFWQVLGDHGVPHTIYRLPANFPPVPSNGQSLSGMGTPDLLGTPGTFSYYTDTPPKSEKKVTGGTVYEVEVRDHIVEAGLIGPSNPFRREEKGSKSGGEKVFQNPDTRVGFTVYLDPERPVAKFEVGGNEFILQEGEWSDWIRIDFEAVPWLVSFSGIARFYLKEVRPDFKLYVTPLQINPEDPVMPISSPEDWCCTLCEHLGYFYTQEMPEDTKALTHGVFTGREFKQQADFVYAERNRAMDYLLHGFKEGLLFVYFSSVDQQCHMMWRYADKEHPGFDPTENLADSLVDVYRQTDEVLGRVLNRIDQDTVLIVMSDHGFCPFYWGFNLNSWLVEKGYVKLKNPRIQGRRKFFGNVKWDETSAYALGLNGLYVNLKGREKAGIVKQENYEELLDRLENDLLEIRDPKNGERVVTLVTRPIRDFHGPYKDKGPDLLVGYNWGYRSSWESPLGEFPKQILVENLDAWSADHCVDYRQVPGVLLTNQRITINDPSLVDLTVAVLDEYGIEPLPEMIGKDCLQSRREKKLVAK